METQSNNLLDYAQPVPAHRRRKTRRWALLTILVSGGIWLSPKFWHQSQVLWWQRQCMNYTASADQVVYDDGPGAAALLRGGDMLSPSPSFSTGSALAVRPVRQWDRLRDLEPEMLSHCHGALLYIHEGRDAHGARRLIAVTLNARSHYFLEFQSWELVPATPSTAMRLFSGVDAVLMASSAANKPLRLYSGQPDPADSSHFTIRYELAGQAGTFEGRVNGNGDIHLSIRDGPAKGNLAE